MDLDRRSIERDSLNESILEEFLNAKALRPSSGLYPKNPWLRPSRATADSLNLTTHLNAQDLNTQRCLDIQRLLHTIYEQDLLFLNSRYSLESDRAEFNEFYSDQVVAAGKYIRPDLERAAFGFLNSEIEISGEWDFNLAKQFMFETLREQDRSVSSLCEVIQNSKCPVQSAQMLVIQQAPDFLSEASAMARSMPGSFGVEQSELMKIFIDEFGYGVHPTKHSTLFENLMVSLGMSPSTHHYYSFYLPTSLLLTNYFHYVCSNKTLWFRYLGALFYTEASIPHFNKQVSSLLKRIFSGLKVNTTYYDEHVHIDRHHRQMVFDHLITPSIHQYGRTALIEILRGFEEFRLLQELADADLEAQIEFSDSIQVPLNHLEPTNRGPVTYFREVRGEISMTHIHSGNELFSIEQGELEFHFNGIEPICLKAGQSILIPKGRVHGTVVSSEECTYQVSPFEGGSNVIA